MAQICRIDDVIAYLEEKMKWNEETEKEIDLYLDYKQYGEKVALEINRHTYKKVLKNMNDEFDGYI